MKANRLAKDEGGDFGIGTMIIFIAMIIVAVVAATVMITTMNKLQTAAEATGNEALQQMSSGVNIKNVLGSRMTAGIAAGIPGLGDLFGTTGIGERQSSFVQELDILVELRAGSLPINLDRTIVRVVTTTDVVNYAGEPMGDEDARSFVEITPVRDSEGSIAQDHALSKMGDIAAIKIDISDLGIGPGETFEIQIIPDVGGIPTVTGVRMPLAYAHDAAQIQLYP